MNRASMETIRRAFGVPAGLSDHTRGIHISVAAAALGASIIEKHFTLDRTMEGPTTPSPSNRMN
jgi:N-acetylneuraminate synthase/N,N'-diacetyllegionaminate synthase